MKVVLKGNYRIEELPDMPTLHFTRTTAVVLHVVLIVLQGTLSDLLPLLNYLYQWPPELSGLVAKFGHGLVGALQMALGVRAYSLNPDATPASVAYAPPPKG